MSKLKDLIEADVFKLSEYELLDKGVEYHVHSGWIRRRELIGWLQTSLSKLKNLERIDKKNGIIN